MQQHTFVPFFFPSFFLWVSIVLIVGTSYMDLVYMAQINFIGKLWVYSLETSPLLPCGQKVDVTASKSRLVWAGPDDKPIRGICDIQFSVSLLE